MALKKYRCYKHVAWAYRIVVFLLAISAYGLYAAGDLHAVKYYYVHPGATTGLNNGSDWTNAWQSFTHVNWAQLSADAATQPVYLYVKKGSLSTARLYPGINNGGSSDTNRVIVTTDPSDTGPNPIISASTRMTGTWTNVSGEIYSIQPTGWNYDAESVWEDTTFLLRKRADVNLEQGEFFIDTTTTPYTIYVRMSDGADPTTHLVDVNNARANIHLYRVEYMTIENIDLRHGGDWGVARAYEAGNIKALD